MPLTVEHVRAARGRLPNHVSAGAFLSTMERSASPEPSVVTGRVPSLVVDETVEGSAVCLRPVGELDVATAPLLERRLARLRRRGVPVRLDLAAVDFMCSAGVHLLARTSALAERDGWAFRATGASPAVAGVLDACGRRALVAR